MAQTRLHARRDLYFQLSSQIARMEDTQLRLLLDKSPSQRGWGRNQTIKVGRSRVFVKRIPMTDLEYENMFSTKNLYDLPTYYNYGVGSAGLGVFRELVTHIKTTNWVLAGQVATFPLMYQYRILPYAGDRVAADTEWLQRYVEYWGNHPNIGRYILDRIQANHEVALFLEYIPYTLAAWLFDHPGKIHQMLADVRDSISFLRRHGIIHFDAHFFNILTDGKRSYLTDFGLALDRSFALTTAEKSFYQRNVDYDYGELLWCLGAHLHRLYQGLPETERNKIAEKFGMDQDAPFEERMSVLLNHIDEIHAEGMLKLDRRFAASLVRYRGVITLMNDFYAQMRGSNKKDASLKHPRLRRLLRETRFIAGALSNS